MDSKPTNLADIETRWSQVLAAGQTRGHEARNGLVMRYHAAIQRYVQAKLAADPAGADALVSDFAQRLLELDPFLRRADPTRGRFRHYLSVVLHRMVQDHFREKGRQGKKQKPLLVGSDAEPVTSDEVAEEDPEFLTCWKQELVNQAWKALQQSEKQSGQLFYTLVLASQENPKYTSQQLADQVGSERGVALTAANVRQVVRRGRELFGELLVKEIARSLEEDGGDKATAAQVEQELISLGLLNDYCKKALEKWT